MNGGLYVRAVHGPGSAWYRATRARQEGHIRAGGVSKDVSLVDAPQRINAAVDTAYRATYGRYAMEIVKTVTGPGASSTAMRLDPRRP
ncbi:DUF2255 family protein [Streptomyces sp. NPDC020192]|uniref:DUF2255 family protein n=1 Tax=Streptomyces sp. NPDC020192 TaxID=3365066 RepID=UPI0037A38F62